MCNTVGDRNAFAPRVQLKVDVVDFVFAINRIADAALSAAAGNVSVAELQFGFAMDCNRRKAVSSIGGGRTTGDVQQNVVGRVHSLNPTEANSRMSALNGFTVKKAYEK